MKVLFVTEPFSVEPLGIAYLAASLKKHGHEPELLRINDNGFLHEFSELNPDVVAFSVTTGKQRKFLELARRMKKLNPDVKIIFGGSHPTYFPEIISNECIDAVIRGEADKALPELIDELQVKKQCRRLTEFRTLEQNIDRIPFPDREFLYKYPENRNNPIKNVITSRGCRFSCPYCFNSIYKDFYKGQEWVRFRSADNVIKECVELKKYPLKLIFFQDDEFLSNPDLYEFLRKYKVQVGVPFHCQIRIELLTDEKAQRLKEAGCTGVTFAVECGDPEIRKNLLQRNMTDEQIFKGVELLHKYGFKIRTENMLGLPGESLSQMLKTLKINAKIRPTIGWCSIFQPYPRLPLGEYAYQKGYWSGKGEYSETFFETTMLNTPLKKEVINLQRLFGVAVHSWCVKVCIKALIKIPNNKTYDRIAKWWKQRQYNKLYQ
jgi:radical SAM superfamily enzyme YgiQ (UPF0313 family)